MRPVCFYGRSLEIIKAFPRAARREAGYQLDRIQRGLRPDDWKPLPRVGKGVKEIRIRDNGHYRLIYLTVFDEEVHVLHAFRKKAQRIRLQDIRTAQKAYRWVTRHNE